MLSLLRFILIFIYISSHNVSQDCPLHYWLRLKICLGVANGIYYLHKASLKPLVHRNITSDNILLGRNYVPKISDFGLSKVIRKAGPERFNHSSDNIANSNLNMPPEASEGKFSRRSDVFSFGIVSLYFSSCLVFKIFGAVMIFKSCI